MNLFVVQTLQPTFRHDTDLRMKAISAHNVNNANEIDIVLYSRLYYAKGEIEYVLRNIFVSRQKYRTNKASQTI